MSRRPIDHHGARLQPADLAPFRRGNVGIEYVTTLESGAPGPHVCINALSHGNEPSGALALVRLFEDGIRPTRGRLTLSFANVAAAEAGVRCLDQDLNRVWSTEALDGARTSRELARARSLRALIDRVDVLLDLHSMQSPGPPVLLAGPRVKAARLALALGAPGYVVRDFGPAGGRRLIDYGGFADPDSPKIALLLECGQHDDAGGVAVALDVIHRLLAKLALIDAPPPRGGQRLLEVTHAVRAHGASFRLTQPFRNLETILRAGTVIAEDGERRVRTPYDRCRLVLPAERAQRGQTAVRLARMLPEGAPVGVLAEPE